jgi:hypothetical protein
MPNTRHVNRFKNSLQLVFIMEILEKKDLETIQKEAIRKLLVIAIKNQQHLRDSQKINVNDMADTVKRNLSRKVKTTLSKELLDEICKRSNVAGRTGKP